MHFSFVLGIKIPENCVARVREELLQMDEEVKRRRKEKEKQAVEQRLADERLRKMEQENKHLLENLFNQKPMPNQSLAQSLAQSQILKPKLNQNPLQRKQTVSMAQLLRMQAQSALQQPPQNLTLLSLPRNSSQTQQRTHNSWPNNSTNNNQGPLPNPVNPSPNFPPFYPQSFLSSFPQLKNQSLPIHQTAPSPNLSSKNPLEDILDLTVSSSSPSPDTTEGGLNLDSLTHSAAFGDDFNLESLISQNAPNAQHAAQIQQPLLLQQQQQQQQHLQATQQQNHSLMANNHQDLLDLFELPLSPQIPTQKASPSSSTSSGSSSTSSTSSVSNNLVSHVSSGLLPAATLIPPSSSSSLFSSPSPSSSLFSNSSSHFSPAYLLPQSDSLSLANGHGSSGTLDVREALNSMLQAGPDRKSVIHYRQQD